jgi:hypothetical protein
MPEKQIDLSEILIVPLARMIREIGEGIAEAQKALDSSAMESQNSLEEKYPDLAKIGYQVTWYQMPEVQVELKIAMHYENSGTEKEGKKGLFLSLFNAKYQNNFSYSSEGASTLKLRIVPIPPATLKNIS